MKRKGLFGILLIAVVTITMIVGGTMAYFTDTEQQTSTMTIGQLDITLQEYTDDKNSIEWDDQKDGKLLVPGDSVTKKPTVTLKENSVSSYLFMEISGANTMLTQGFSISGFNNTNWQKLEDLTTIDGIYVYVGNHADDYIVEATSKDIVLPELFTTVTYNIENKESANDIKNTLEIKAYAIQSKNITTQKGIDGAKEAWQLLKNN